MFCRYLGIWATMGHQNIRKSIVFGTFRWISQDPDLVSSWFQLQTNQRVLLHTTWPLIEKRKFFDSERKFSKCRKSKILNRADFGFNRLSVPGYPIFDHFLAFWREKFFARVLSLFENMAHHGSPRHREKHRVWHFSLNISRPWPRIELISIANESACAFT